MVDAQSVESRLQRLSELIEEMDAIRSRGRSAYESDFTLQLAGHHAIQQAIQICIDVGTHVIAEEGLSIPSDYRGVFTALAPCGLDADLAKRLGNAAGMRNILVHGYLEVDEDAVWSALGESGDLREFAEFVQGLTG